MTLRRALITLGVDPLAPVEHYQAQMRALWTGRSIECDMSQMTRAERFAVLDDLAESCPRGDAPVVIDLWSSDHQAHRGLAADTWHTVRDRVPTTAA